jgi:hypothetical protein
VQIKINKKQNALLKNNLEFFSTGHVVFCLFLFALLKYHIDHGEKNVSSRSQLMDSLGASCVTESMDIFAENICDQAIL